MTQWSWLIYMGADNDLDESTAADLDEMKKANPEEVQLVVQVDHLDRATKRHMLVKGNAFLDFPRIKSKIAHTTNMDSRNPVVISSFLRFAQGKAPSKHRAVVFWSHTAGFQNFSFEGADPEVSVPKKPRKQGGGKEHTAEYESVSRFLRHANMARALEMAREERKGKEKGRKKQKEKPTLQPPFEIIGCDSCLMSMVEVAHEIREHGVFLVASQSNISREGWDYGDVLSRFTVEHTPDEVAKFVVEAGRKKDKTMFAIRLDRMKDVAKALDELGAELLPLLESRRDAIGKARDEVRLFPRLGYIDLHHFATLLKKHLGNAIDGAADSVIKAVEAAVLTPAETNDTARGLTVYVPTIEVDENYKKLSLATAAEKWAEFVTKHATL